MNKKAIAGILAAIALLVGLGCQALSLPDFVSGLIAGVCIVVEVVALITIVKEVKADKQN
ncbi:MAG: hypothetical protein MJ124_05800 [Lachnospiraceae bacterium]|nr:hypothetical protein [Lachnospiraceae bacterium]